MSEKLVTVCENCGTEVWWPDSWGAERQHLRTKVKELGEEHEKAELQHEETRLEISKDYERLNTKVKGLEGELLLADARSKEELTRQSDHFATVCAEYETKIKELQTKVDHNDKLQMLQWERVTELNTLWQIATGCDHLADLGNLANWAVSEIGGLTAERDAKEKVVEQARIVRKEHSLDVLSDPYSRDLCIVLDTHDKAEVERGEKK